MCGIVAVLRRRSTRPAPTAEELLGHLSRAEAGLQGKGGDELETRLGRGGR